MATSTTTITTTTVSEDHIAMTPLHPQSPNSPPSPLPQDASSAAYTVTAIPDGGAHAWLIVLCCSTTTFCHNSIINCWGVLQAALLTSTLSHTPASTLSYVGTLGLAGGCIYSLPAIRLTQHIGCRLTVILGILLMALSLVTASFCTENLPGLFATYGVVGGVGMAMVYAVANTLPVQYFSAHLGLANGLIKLGGGIGGCVMAVALEALNRRLGIAWTFRVQGIMTLVLGLPAACMLRDRVPVVRRNVPVMDLTTMFQSKTYIATFVASAVGVFALFVPSYYLPLFAASVGLSPKTGAGLVAAFNACSAIGRFLAGPLCDMWGPLNMFVITMALNAVSMLAIWPVSSTLGPLVVFAILNGVANGAYFTTQPTVVAGIFGPGRAAVAMSMSVTGWTGGYLMGAPIAGYLLQAAGGKQDAARGQSVDVYRPAIFYAGGTATVSALCVIFARLTVARQLKKRV